MTEAAQNQMCSSSSTSSSSSSSLCFCRQYLIISVLVLLAISTCFSCSFVSPILVSFAVLILSTLLLISKSKNQKQGLESSIVTTDEILISSITEEPTEAHEEVVPKEQPLLENEAMLEPILKEAQVGSVPVHDYVLTKLSDCESVGISSSSEESDVEWSTFGNDSGQFAMYSDDSISDDESLIEIELPGGHYVGGTDGGGAKEVEPITKFKKSEPILQHFFQEQFFKQEGLMELLAELNEMNEEENLIEIDISMGSIKCCSRLEIEA